MAKQDYDDKEIKHLEMIESVIERMGQNSFALKGWTMTLVVAISAFSAAGTERKFALVAIAPIIAFWFLDSFYLQKERKYRELYKNVTAHKAAPFNMDISNVTGKKTACSRRPKPEWVSVGCEAHHRLTAKRKVQGRCDHGKIGQALRGIP